MRISDWSSDVCSSDLPPASRDLGAARIGHDTVGAEFVAAFLHGEEGRGSLLATRGQRTELGFHGHVGVERALAGLRFRHQLRQPVIGLRSEEHTSELQSLMRISYAVFCLKKKKNIHLHTECSTV